MNRDCVYGGTRTLKIIVVVVVVLGTREYVPGEHLEKGISLSLSEVVRNSTNNDESRDAPIGRSISRESTIKMAMTSLAGIALVVGTQFSALSI